MIGLCLRSVMYSFEDGAWTEIVLPDNKGNEWRIHDFSFLDAQRGFAVGFSDQGNEPLILLRNAGGWQKVPPLDLDSGLALYGVSVWEATSGSDDDTSDDDTADDDTADDDTGDDDTADDDTGDDDTADDDTGDDDTADDDA